MSLKHLVLLGMLFISSWSTRALAMEMQLPSGDSGTIASWPKSSQKAGQLVLGAGWKQMDDCCSYNAILQIFQCQGCMPKLTTIPSNIPKEAILVDLCDNAIAEIPGGAFSDLHQLLALSMCNNSVVTIHPEAWAGLHHLTQIDLEGNRLTEVPAHFPETVLRLGLRRNRLEEVNADSLQNLTHLEFLSISAETFTSGAFRHLIFLKDTQFSPCRIQPYAFDAMSRETDFAELHIEGTCQQVESPLTLDTNAFSRYPRQRILIHNVYLPQIPWRAFVTLPQVHEISLTHIRGLQDFLPGAFDNVSEVATFTLQGRGEASSRITIHNGVFQDLHGLVTLTLTQLGTVENIEPHAFDQLERLRVLTLSENNLTTLDRDVLGEVVGRLERLDVSLNSWRCDCNLRWLREMMDEHTGVFDNRENVICSTPSNLYNKRFIDLSPNDFVC